MQSNPKPYDHEASFARLREILNQPDISYEDGKALPPRERLTFTNGYYAYCSALFVDIRGSSKLPETYRRPTLARLYRAYISELVAVMNRDERCTEINIVGDGVWCVVNTPTKPHIDAVFSTAAMAYSMVKVLNYELGRRRIEPLRVGIGMEYGRALMIKAGYAGSGINDVVYMGDVVNKAAKLAAHGSETMFDHPMMVGGVFRRNLNDHNKQLLSWNGNRGCWHGTVVNTEMNNWYLNHCT